MTLRAHLVGYRFLSQLKNAALRTGIYVGIDLSVVLVAWLLLANRVAFLERFAWERNVAGAAAIGLLVLVPAVRFCRFPSRLFVSGNAAWAIFCLSYWICGFIFPALATRIGAFHLFMLGSVLYTIAATLAWIGTVIWAVRHHHLSQTRQNLS